MVAVILQIRWCGRLIFLSFQFFLLWQNVSKLSMNKREETGRETWEEGGGGAIDEEGASNWTWSIRASHGCPANIRRWWIMGLLAIFSPCCRVWGLFFCMHAQAVSTLSTRMTHCHPNSIHEWRNQSAWFHWNSHPLALQIITDFFQLLRN